MKFVDWIDSKVKECKFLRFLNGQNVSSSLFIIHQYSNYRQICTLNYSKFKKKHDQIKCWQTLIQKVKIEEARCLKKREREPQEYIYNQPIFFSIFTCTRFLSLWYSTHSNTHLIFCDLYINKHSRKAFCKIKKIQQQQQQQLEKELRF